MGRALYGAGVVILIGSLSVSKEPSLDKARALLDGLSESNRSRLVLPFDEERAVWAFTPGPRKGLNLKQMSPAERALAFELLKSALSESGFQKVEQIRNLEPVLREMENNPGRDENLYFVTFYGTPQEAGQWGWRWEGHHLSLHFTYRDGQIVSNTPQFLGSNPAEVRTGAQKGTSVLAHEEGLGRRLANLLNDGQRKKAILAAAAPADILTSNVRQAGILADEGISFTDLDDRQKKLLHQLVETHNAVQRSDQGKRRLEKIAKAGWDNVKFAWMGGLEPGQGHYYRIQGPTFLIEYDNTQNGANHIHTVWRDFAGDFGRDVLAEHGAAEPNPHR